MSRIGWITTVVVSLGLWGIGPGGVSADLMQGASLKGLRGLFVLTGASDTKAELEWFNRSNVQTAAEAKLRESGIHLMTEREWKETKGKPYLFVSVMAVKSGSMYGCSIDTELRQDVFLDRDAMISIEGVPTWSSSYVGVASEDDMPTVIHETVNEAIDRFIIDYLAANPEP